MINISRYNSFDERLRLHASTKTIKRKIVMRHVSPNLSEDQRLIKSTNQTPHVTPCHLQENREKDRLSR